MKTMLLWFSMIVLRCCWGPTDYQIMQDLQNDDTLLKTLNGTYNINTLNLENRASFSLNITFDENTKKVSGFSGCNRFFGSYLLNENTLKFNALGSTRMLCSKDKNKIESKLLKAFEKADNVLFSENGFSLFNNKKRLLSATKITEEKNLSFEYSAASRGGFKLIRIEKDSIQFSKNRKGKTLKIPCDSEYWKKITELSHDIDFKNLSNIEAPSKKFQYDGASLARLKIILDGNIYKSVPFDDDNPPKEIAALVKEILSSTKNIE